MKKISNINDNTVLRVRIPKALYESIKKKLALKEGKVGKKVDKKKLK